MPANSENIIGTSASLRVLTGSGTRGSVWDKQEMVQLATRRAVAFSRGTSPVAQVERDEPQKFDDNSKSSS